MEGNGSKDRTVGMILGRKVRDVNTLAEKLMFSLFTLPFDELCSFSVEFYAKYQLVSSIGYT